MSFGFCETEELKNIRLNVFQLIIIYFIVKFIQKLMISFEIEINVSSNW